MGLCRKRIHNLGAIILTSERQGERERQGGMGGMGGEGDLRDASLEKHWAASATEH